MMFMLQGLEHVQICYIIGWFFVFFVWFGLVFLFFVFPCPVIRKILICTLEESKRESKELMKKPLIIKMAVQVTIYLNFLCFVFKISNMVYWRVLHYRNFFHKAWLSVLFAIASFHLFLMSQANRGKRCPLNKVEIMFQIKLVF